MESFMTRTRFIGSHCGKIENPFTLRRIAKVCSEELKGKGYDEGGVDLIIEISAGIVAFAILILTIYLIRSLLALTRTMKSVQGTLDGLKEKVEETLDESTRTLKETRLLVEDLRIKSQQADEMFKSLEDVGKNLQEVSAGIIRQAELHKDRLSHVVALISAGIDLVKQWCKKP
jgi:uncharacterized protein YoxC